MVALGRKYDTGIFLSPTKETCFLFLYTCYLDEDYVPRYARNFVLYHFTVANTRFTAPLTRRGKTKFATIKWYDLCLQIILSQTCYPLIPVEIKENSHRKLLSYWHGRLKVPTTV